MSSNNANGLSDSLKDELIDDAQQQAKQNVREYMSEFDGDEDAARTVSLEDRDISDIEDGSLHEELENNQALQETAIAFHRKAYVEAVDQEIEKSDVPHTPMSNRRMAAYFPAGSEERGLLNDSDD